MVHPIQSTFHTRQKKSAREQTKQDTVSSPENETKLMGHFHGFLLFFFAKKTVAKEVTPKEPETTVIVRKKGIIGR